MTRAEWLLVGTYLLEAHEVEHFRAYEVADVGRTRGSAVLTAPPPTVAQNALVLYDEALEWIRNRLGEPAAVHVSSWYRSPEYNRAVGGASRSVHMTGAAADINKSGWSPRDLALAIHRSHPQPEVLGVGLYQTFVHVDVRGFLGRRAPARWSGAGVPSDWWQG
jgi:hypothetical protein